MKRKDPFDWEVAANLKGDFSVAQALEVLEAPENMKQLLAEIVQHKRHRDWKLFSECYATFWNTWFSIVKGNTMHYFLEAAALVGPVLPTEAEMEKLEEKQKACNFLWEYLGVLRDPNVTFLDNSGNFAVDRRGNMISFLPKLEVTRLC